MARSAALPASVQAETGRGGLDRLTVTAQDGSAEIHLQGAHLSAWAPHRQSPVIWMSASSTFAPGEPLRGGVPVCFPWFGPHPTGAGPLHGFARTTPWTLEHVGEEGGDVALVLGVGGGDVASDQVAAWPHPFRAQLTVTVGSTLTLALEVTNTGPDPLTYEEALHTYLAVADVRGVVIEGLEHSPYLDRVAGAGRSPARGEPLRIVDETDRVYDQPARIRVVDPAGGRALDIRAAGSNHAVVWNPGPGKAAAMADFGDDEWVEMLCIETANVLDGAITLGPGERHTMTAWIQASTS